MTKIISTSAHDECERLLERYNGETPDPVDYLLTARELVMEARILLVCEGLRHRKNEKEQLENLLPLEEQLKDGSIVNKDVVEVVRQRLFEPQSYSARLKTVRRLFTQISRADYDRVVMRPARTKRK